MDRSLLNKASDSSDIPTPGYLFIDIKRMINFDVLISGKVIEYLINNRLCKNNHNTKVKVLKIIYNITSDTDNNISNICKRCIIQIPIYIEGRDSSKQ